MGGAAEARSRPVSVFVNTTGASFPFLRRIAGRGRVVLTATDSVAQQFETVFADFFVKAFDDPSADLDKNGRVSMRGRVHLRERGRKHGSTQKGQLPTERPLLDDDGDGIGREAQNPGRRRRDGAGIIWSRTRPCAAAGRPRAWRRSSAATRRAGDAARGAGGAQGSRRPPISTTPSCEKMLVDRAGLGRSPRKRRDGSAPLTIPRAMLALSEDEHADRRRRRSRRRAP